MFELAIAFRDKDLVLRQLDKIVSKIERRGVLVDLAAMAKRLTKARTLDGRDMNDGALKPSKRAQRDNGQTLSDKGHMLGALSVLSVTAERAVLGFGSATEAKKALWAQDGTKAHSLAPGGKSPLAWKPGGGRAAGGVWHYSRGHMHPGTPPRPFFGLSPKDKRELTAECDRLVGEALSAAEALR